VRGQDSIGGGLKGEGGDPFAYLGVTPLFRDSTYWNGGASGAPSCLVHITQDVEKSYILRYGRGRMTAQAGGVDL